MTTKVIEVSKIAKRYRIGGLEPYKAFRDTLTSFLKNPFTSKKTAKDSKVHWALDDVSFDVNQGDVLGIIGRNGSGKTTLLKVLSRVTSPTRGKALIKGNVAALLEVGTGFHPELTGRENIYLSGAILGMKRKEIKRKFDEIVAFSEVEKFIDTPLKRYSTGMKVRLAFAVPAHLESEILFIDEVLAVGDNNFQKKCLGKMENASKEGKTALFVSHSMPAVLRLCNRVILLNNGKLIKDGPSNEVIRSYLESEMGSTAKRSWNNFNEAPGDDIARIKSIQVLNQEGVNTETLDITKPFSVEVEYWKNNPRSNPSALLSIYNQEGICLFTTSELIHDEWKKQPNESSLVKSTCHIPGNFFAEGQFSITLILGSFNPNLAHACEKDAVAFQIVDKNDGNSVRGEYANEWAGVVRPCLQWNTKYEPLKKQVDCIQ